MQAIKLIPTILFFLSFYLSLEMFKRKFNIHSEVTRKLAHLLSGFFAILFSYFLNKNEFIIAALIFFGFFSVARTKKFLKSINIDHRKTYGEIFYPLGLIALAMGLYHTKNLFIIGVLILAIPDTIAGYIGFKLGKKNKSFLGSLAYFSISLIILLLSLGLRSSILFASILTLVEFIFPLGLDNLSVPLIYCLLVFILQL